MKKRPNLSGFIYLLISGLITQLIGSVYRIWLARRIGPEALGIQQMVYPVYRLLSGLATLGFPLALTKWVAEYLAVKEYASIGSILNWAVRVVFIIALITGSALFLGAPYLSEYVFTDHRIKDALLVIAFAIPFSALSAIYRGYFQGFSNTAPTAASEIAEQFSEVSATYLMVCILAPFLPSSIYTFPLAGLTIGEIACLLCLVLFLKRQTIIKATQIELPIPKPEIIRYSWPLLFNQLITSASLTSEGVIIPFMLKRAGYSIYESTALFGQLTGMAEPIAFFPLILMAPLASVLSPQVSAVFKTGSLNEIKCKISKFYLVSSLICLIGYFIIQYSAADLARFLYGDSTGISIGLIKILVIGLPFTGISILNNTMLAAVGATDKILFLSLWVVGLKTFLIYTLTPLFGVYGSAWAINIIQIFIALASLAALWPFLPKSGGVCLPRWRPPCRCRAELL